MSSKLLEVLGVVDEQHFAVAEDSGSSSCKMEDSEEHNGDGELLDQAVEEVEADTGLPKITLASFGGLLENGAGTVVDGYQAVNRGLNRFIPPRYFAQLLFAAAEQKMIWITETVPQKIMCNSVFVVDMKNFESEAMLFRDGLGSWIQNCGKVTNYFVWEHDEAREVKPGAHPDAMEFVRRIDKNSSCSAYTRVTIICSQLGLAALQYFFKGQSEQVFQISYHRPKKSTAPNTPNNTLSPVSAGTRSRLKRKDPSQSELDDAVESLTGTPAPTTTQLKSARGNSAFSSGRSLVGSVPTVAEISLLNHVEPADVSPGTLIAYLREHIASDRKERLEDRKLRLEEIEQRRRERVEDRQMQKEELDVRKQELALQRTRMNLEQQKWDIERKEKELFLDVLRKQLLDS